MKSLQIANGLVACAVLALTASGPVQAQTAAPATPPPATPAGAVEPEAQAALEQMSAYLRTLESFSVDTRTSIDVVTDTGQRIQLDGTGAYKVRRPDGFVITVATDMKKRTFFYDGKTFTIYAPELGYYASASAPATIRQTLDIIDEKFGIVLPLEDLFRWNDPSQRRPEPLDSAMQIGPATIDGVATEQYAFRRGELDWQLWIQKGPQPLPRKLVIIARTELGQPAYSAVMTWKLNPPVTSDEFAFRPGKDAKPIRLTAIGEKK